MRPSGAGVAFAEDASLAWGQTHGATRQFLSSSEPQWLPMLMNMEQVLAHFEQGSQADASDFIGYLWEYANTTFFGSKFFHWTLSGHLEEREQMPLNILFPAGDSVATLDELISDWATAQRGHLDKT